MLILRNECNKEKWTPQCLWTVPWTAPATRSSSLLSITWLLSLLITLPLLRLVSWLIPGRWWTATAPSPRGWSAVIPSAAWSFFVVISFPLVPWFFLFLGLILVPRFYFAVCSDVRPSSGTASSTTIVIVVAIVVSSAVRWNYNSIIEIRILQ